MKILKMNWAIFKVKTNDLTWYYDKNLIVIIKKRKIDLFDNSPFPFKKNKFALLHFKIIKNIKDIIIIIYLYNFNELKVRQLN